MALRISFIIPAYNGKAYIEACLQSLAAQKMDDMEVIVVDDGSTDQSGSICERFAETDSRFRVIHQENGGHSAARNTGLKAAKGEWICFVDHDDKAEEYFSEKLNWDAYQDSDVVFFRFSRLNRAGEISREPNDGFCGKLPETAYKDMMRILLNADWIKRAKDIPSKLSISEPWGKLYRRSFLIEHHILFNTQLIKHHEDICFNMDVFQYHPILYAENFYEYIYRYNASSISHSYSADAADQIAIAYAHIAGIVNGNAETKNEFGSFLFLRAIKNFLFCCMMNYFNPQNPKARRQRKKEFLSLRSQPVYQEAFSKGDLSLLRPSVRIGAVLCKYKLFTLYEIAWKLAGWLKISNM